MIRKIGSGLYFTFLFATICFMQVAAADNSKITAVEIKREYRTHIGDIAPASATYKSNSKKYSASVTPQFDYDKVKAGDSMHYIIVLQAQDGFDFAWLKLSSCTSTVGETTNLSISADKKTAILEYTANPLPVELPSPSGLEWDGTAAKWKRVEWADRYDVSVYRILSNGKLSNKLYAFTTSKTEIELKSATHHQPGDYVFSVIAKGAFNKSYIQKSQKKTLPYDKSILVLEEEIGQYGGVWHKIKTNLKYAVNPGTVNKHGYKYLTDGRYLVEGYHYYFNVDGSSQTGWQYYDNKWSYHGDDGRAVTGWFQHEGKSYYLNPKDSLMITGILTLSEKKYYFDADGSMKTGWVKIEHDLYYFKIDGSAQITSMVDKNGKSYNFTKDGKLIQ